MVNDFYTPKELAALAGVHVTYIRQLLQAGKLKGVKVGSFRRGNWMIACNVGDKWLEERRVKALGIRQERF